MVNSCEQWQSGVLAPTSSTAKAAARESREPGASHTEVAYRAYEPDRDYCLMYTVRSVACREPRDRRYAGHYKRDVCLAECVSSNCLQTTKNRSENRNVQTPSRPS